MFNMNYRQLLILYIIHTYFPIPQFLLWNFLNHEKYCWNCIIKQKHQRYLFCNAPRPKYK